MEREGGGEGEEEEGKGKIYLGVHGGRKKMEKMSKPKKTQQNTSPITSPGAPKSVGMMLIQDIVKELQNNFQAALLLGLNQVQQSLIETSNQIKEQIRGVENKLEQVQKQVL